MDTKQFANRHKIKATVEWADSNPNMADPDWRANHFKATLRKGRRQMTVYFSQGFGIEGEPSAADVLDCLASDAAGIENAKTFEDWCGEYGYDTDSRRAERTYRAVERQTEALRRLLGESFNALLWDTERL